MTLALGENGLFGRKIQPWLHLEVLAVAAVFLFIGAVGLDMLFNFGELRALLGNIFFLVLPGALMLTLFGYRPQPRIEWLLYTVGTSLLIITIVGFVLNLVGGMFGVSAPMSSTHLVIYYVGLVLVLAVTVWAYRSNTKGIDIYASSDRWKRRWIQPPTLTLLLIPPIMILSLYWLNIASDNRPLILLLVLIAFLPLGVVAGSIKQRWIPLAIGVVSISLLHHGNLGKHSNFSGHGSIISAWQSGSFGVGSQSLLPNVTITPTLAHLSGVNIFTQLDAFNPLWIALIPLGSYVVFRRFAAPSQAALGAFLVMFSHPFFNQIASGVRAYTPTLFLVLMIVALTDPDTDPILRRGLSLAFAAGVVTSHYGASYFVMAGLGISLLTLIGLKVLDGFIFDQGGRPIRSDWGEVASTLQAKLQKREHALSLTFVVFYVLLTFSWYLYTSSGNYFSSFIRRVQSGLTSFLAGGAGGGGTANRLSRDYGTASIELSRTIYVILAVLTAIGVAYLLIQRFVDSSWRERDGFDEYLVLGIGMLGVFLLTFVLRSLWGGGRPMALTFSVTALFAPIGVFAILEFGSKINRWYARQDSESGTKRQNIRIAGVAFASLLAVFLLLNSGVAAATVLGGTAPSNTPLQPITEERVDEDPSAQQSVHFQQDVSKLVWINTYSDGNKAYGDEMVRQRNNDIYQPHIVAGIEPGEQQSFGWTPNLFSVIDERGEAYAVLPSYSVNLNIAEDPDGSSYTGARKYKDITPVNERLSEESKVYTNGDAEIYRTG